MTKRAHEKGPRLSRIQIVRTVDPDPDTSTLGEWTDDVRNPWHILRVGEYAGRYIADLTCQCVRCDECDGETCCPICAQCVGCDGHATPDCPGCPAPPDFVMPERGREYRAFKPYAGGETPGTADYRAAGLQDWKRMEDLERQEWYYVGVRAEARVVMPSGTMQTIRSAGLWGIESDSDDDYFADVAREECAQLAADLDALGVPPRVVRDATRAALARGLHDA